MAFKETGTMGNCCQKPDRDVPGILCGYPLPCPYHTVTVDSTGVVPEVRIPATAVPYVSAEQLAVLKDIARTLHKDDR